jgi:hypothetical protein
VRRKMLFCIIDTIKCVACLEHFTLMRCALICNLTDVRHLCLFQSGLRACTKPQIAGTSTFRAGKSIVALVAYSLMTSRRTQRRLMPWLSRALWATIFCHPGCQLRKCAPSCRSRKIIATGKSSDEGGTLSSTCCMIAACALGWTVAILNASWCLRRHVFSGSTNARASRLRGRQRRRCLLCSNPQEPGWRSYLSICVVSRSDVLSHRERHRVPAHCSALAARPRVHEGHLASEISDPT